MQIAFVNTIELFDSFFNNTQKLKERIEKINGNERNKYIVVRLTNFEDDRDRYIRYLLQNETNNKNLSKHLIKLQKQQRR